eukprot:scaffold5311_cov19-Tisochrysis_lutea.AAC.1
MPCSLPAHLKTPRTQEGLVQLFCKVGRTDGEHLHIKRKGLRPTCPTSEASILYYRDPHALMRTHACILALALALAHTHRLPITVHICPYKHTFKSKYLNPSLLAQLPPAVPAPNIPVPACHGCHPFVPASLTVHSRAPWSLGHHPK